MKPILSVAIILEAVVLVAADRAADPPQVEADIKTLKEAGVEASDAGLLKYLVGLRPTPEIRQEIAALVGRLASEDFAQREKATRRLAALAGLALAELEGASRGKDPEVARRAKAILAEHQTGADRLEVVLLAALREIGRRKVAGAGPLLLEAPAVWERPRVREAAERVLAVADRPADVEAIEQALRASDGHVRFAAALTLLNHGDRRALAVLGGLLDSPDLMVRHRACRLLRVATGQEIDFAAYEDPAVRAKGVTEWRRWIKTDGPAAPLNLPAPAPTWLGRVLVLAIGGHFVGALSGANAHLVEFGEGGEKVWEVKHHMAACCRGLADGHRLVGSNHPGRVDEYDAEGKLVWGMEVKGSLWAVERLPSGNTLVSELDGGVTKVREYRPDKGVCCEMSLPDFATTTVLHRLDGGNLLTAGWCFSDRVLEVDRLGKVVWEFKDLKRISSCQRIDNGDTLISESKGDRVVEVDRGGKVVWSYKVKYPTHAQRLPNGHTAISTLWTVFEIDAGGKVLWEQKLHDGLIPIRLSAY
jgi:hypothetical protein